MCYFGLPFMILINVVRTRAISDKDTPLLLYRITTSTLF